MIQIIIIITEYYEVDMQWVVLLVIAHTHEMGGARTKPPSLEGVPQTQQPSYDLG